MSTMTARPKIQSSLGGVTGWEGWQSQVKLPPPYHSCSLLAMLGFAWMRPSVGVGGGGSTAYRYLSVLAQVCLHCQLQNFFLIVNMYQDSVPYLEAALSL